MTDRAMIRTDSSGYRELQATMDGHMGRQIMTIIMDGLRGIWNGCRGVWAKPSRFAKMSQIHNRFSAQRDVHYWTTS